MSDVLEDFEWTRDYHRGDLSLAAHRLGLSADALEQMLYRARRKGFDVGEFHRLVHD
jgi:lipocalin